ncbi:unnamed protein product [Darwinula stevensoni]|uniref:Uncharacterized protein n=1 Tax=Darwinula stevensoni TaxID=69355 RepID=A0A7R8XMY0_9CRUS|nr:unnamed protein product [Darwinula stevensoni]CAG0896102.1 unnamed protein product [Darwinula stevensoni]
MKTQSSSLPIHERVGKQGRLISILREQDALKKSHSIQGDATRFRNALHLHDDCDTKDVKTADQVQREARWKEKPLHGQHPKFMDKPSIDSDFNYNWLKKELLNAETKSNILAIQDQCIRTRNYEKHILKLDVEDRCRCCHGPPETFQSEYIMAELVARCSASTNYAERLLTTNAIVNSTGEVTLLTGAIFRSTCDVDVTYFPFDIQNCTMPFGSWSQDMTKVTCSLPFRPMLSLKLRIEVIRILMESDHNKTLELMSYIQNEEFTLESYEATKSLEPDPCCPNPFSAVTYAILIKRRTSFFVVSYVLPMVVINILAFLMPSESGEKVTLGISAMLTAIVFLMTIRDVLPPSENMPLIGTMFNHGISITLGQCTRSNMSLEVALSSFILYIHHLRDIQVSLRIQIVCRLLAKLTCMKEPRFRTVMMGVCENEKGKMEFSDGIPVPSLFGSKTKSSRRHVWKGPVGPIWKDSMTGEEVRPELNGVSNRELEPYMYRGPDPFP